MRRGGGWWRVGVSLGAIGLVACAAATPIPPLPAGAGSIGAVRSKSGVVVSELAGFDGVTWVRTPCYGVTVLHDVTRVPAVDVLLDPGHGGNEDGAIGPNGLKEKDLNLAVATRVKARLEAKGRTVLMTRDSDIREPIRTRTDLARGLKPKAFVSIHHNASGPPPRLGRPGTEVFHQATSVASRELARYLWDDETAALARFAIAWSADDNNPGPKFRVGDSGDYYGILREAAGIPAVISEAAFITSPLEADLMLTDAFRDAEADAIATGIDRYLAAPVLMDTSSVAPMSAPAPGQPGATDPAAAPRSSDTLGADGQIETTGTGVVPVTPVTSDAPPATAPPASETTVTVGLPARPPDADDCTDPALE